MAKLRYWLIRKLAGRMTVVINARSAAIIGTGKGGLVVNVVIDRSVPDDAGIVIPW